MPQDMWDYVKELAYAREMPNSGRTIQELSIPSEGTCFELLNASFLFETGPSLLKIQAAE